MGVTAGAGISTEAEPFRAATQAARMARAGLDGERADVAVVFASGAHLASPELTLAAVHAELSPGALVGCGAGGVLGDGRELEHGSGIAVWAAALHDGQAEPFHAVVAEGEGEGDGEGVLQGMPDLAGLSGMIMLCDPFSFPANGVLAGLAQAAPGAPVLGALASGRSLSGDGALLAGDQVLAGGAVGLALRGVEMLPCVSQGAAPLGRELTVTAAEDNVVLELAGRPAVAAIEEAVADLSVAERTLVASGLLIGIVIDSGQPEYGAGDFLVRGVLGVDPSTGAITVGAPVQVGQVVQLHARDAASADDDLRRELELRARATGADGPAGALVFSCSGRGQRMFGVADHDAAVVDDVLGGAPTAGFFAEGEIGPVGGRSFLHTFTATVAVFPA